MSASTQIAAGGAAARSSGFDRSAPRLELKSGAIIRAAKHSFACELCDLSEQGARIKVMGRAVPDRFELLIGDGAVPRLAQVRWARGDEVGVQFVPRAPGDSVPDLYLANIQGKSVNLRSLLCQRRSVLVGVVGAFAPERYQVHLNEVLSRALDLERCGFVRLICAAPNDPWVIKAWADRVDPDRRLTFLSDGNLDLARWLGVSFVTSRRRHLGARSRSYLALLREGSIEKLTIDNIAPALIFSERENPGQITADTF